MKTEGVPNSLKELRNNEGVRDSMSAPNVVIEPHSFIPCVMLLCGENKWS